MQNANTVPSPNLLAVAFALLDIEQVQMVVGLRKSAIYARIKAGDMPAPVVLGERCVRWRSDEIQAWMEGKAAARTASTDTVRHAKARKAVTARHASSQA